MELQTYQNKYCIKLPSKELSLSETVALMVIKKIPITKASKKQNSIKNWKVKKFKQTQFKRVFINLNLTLQEILQKHKK